MGALKILVVLLAFALAWQGYAYALTEDEFRDQVNAMRKGGEKPQVIIDFAEKELAENPDASAKMRSNVASVIGEAYGQLGEVEKGIEYCSKALKIHETVFAYAQMANLLMKKKDYAAAYEHIEKGIALTKDEVQRENLEKSATRILNKYLAVPAAKLYSAFDENEVAAEDEYKGKRVFVKGKISSISTDPFGQPVVSFQGGKDILAKVNCVFGKESRKEAAKLKKGANAVIAGQCDGMTMGAVFIKNCSVIQ